jgi:LAO/AO transport system kinase
MTLYGTFADQFWVKRVSDSSNDLAAAVLDGNRLALARCLTQVENDTSEGRKALTALFPYTGRAHLIGITGSPGAGKSALVSQIASYYRKTSEIGSKGRARPLRVAVIAVDPTSPFTGGAILGDRVRMRDLAGDSGIFIRSMATRGSLGGLARTTAGLAQVMDAAGYEIVLIETVGAGQAEVDIARLAHTTLVVEAPGLGDDIQAIKAGILEIADILVINKADRPGVEATERALRSMLQLAHPVPHVFQHHGRAETILSSRSSGGDLISWIPPIQLTIATEGGGTDGLIDAIENHYQYLRAGEEWQRREQDRLQVELDVLLQETLVTRWRSTISDQGYEQILASLVRREVSPWRAVELLVNGGKG